MKGYKAFEKGMICRGKQYAENTVFKEENAEICKSGMHFVSADNPLEVLEYYPFVDENGNESEFAEVEALDEPITDDNKKFCSKKLKIGGKVSFAKLVQAAVEVNYAKATSEGEQSSGYESSLASSGYGSSLASSGDGSSLASSGYGSSLASSGDWSRLASSGDGSSLASSGYGSSLASSGKNSVICCAGHNCQVKAKKGSWITLAEWDYSGDETVPICVKTEQVDGVRIKEDVFYTLRNGEFQEVSEED